MLWHYLMSNMKAFEILKIESNMGVGEVIKGYYEMGNVRNVKASSEPH